jgi:urease accessory protein
MTAKVAALHSDGAVSPASRRAFPSDQRGASWAVKSSGKLHLEFGHKHSRTVLVKDDQSGCLRARSLVRTSADPATVVLINTAGGLTGGDRIEQSIHWQAGSEATTTTPAAEKIYRSNGGDSVVRTNLRVGSGAIAEWLPQETILFDGSRLDRVLDIDLALDGHLIACDSTIFGRIARNESLSSAYLRDRLRVRRDGKPVLFDGIKVDGSIDDWLAKPWAGHGFRASGTIIVACGQPDVCLTAVRQCLEAAKGLAGATLVRGLIHIRFLAADDADLRHDLSAVLLIVRHGRPLPRNWSF